MKFTEFEIQLIQTGITIAALLLLMWGINGVLNRILKKSQFSRQRRKVATRGLRFIAILIASIFLLAVWGVEQDSIFVFASSLLTILGVAFFAQWSLLSNITAGLILYFNHPLKIGSNIKIEDKDFPIVGRVDDITLFFIKVVTSDNTIVTLPTNLVLQKAIKVEP